MTQPAPMRIAVTGRAGQVVRALAERGMAAGHVIVPIGRPLLNLAGSEPEIIAALAAVRPDAIVSAAAYTAVDRAESEPELAHAINARGAGAVARAATELGVPLVHLSTDYVFSGAGTRPWRETDTPAPTGVYGVSKLAGEEAVLAACNDAAVLRTAWVYSPFGANFARTMLRLAETHDEIGVVADQVGNPTSAFDVAGGVLAVLDAMRSSEDRELRGLFHMAGSREASWADLAEALFAASAKAGGPRARVRRIATADYPTPARRPANSRLDCGRLDRAFGLRLSGYIASAPVVVQRLLDTMLAAKAA